MFDVFNLKEETAELPGFDDESTLRSTAPEVDMTCKRAVRNTILSIAAACLFGTGVYLWHGTNRMLEFLTGYLVELSLSVDNLFVFLLLFDYFKVPLKSQGKVLSWGIIGAVVMRGVMIVVGMAAVHKFRWVTLIFAVILLFSAYSLILAAEEEEEDLSHNTIVKLSKRFFKSSSEYDKDNFFTQENGAIVATPLFICLICIELSDVVFAVDSIPAVLGVSNDPLIVYSSNIFAILTLRSLFSLVAKAVSDMPFLQQSVAAVLGFIGCKMIAEYFLYSISVGLSLLIVFLLILAGVVSSMKCSREYMGVPQDEEEEVEEEVEAEEPPLISDDDSIIDDLQSC